MPAHLPQRRREAARGPGSARVAHLPDAPPVRQSGGSMTGLSDLDDIYPLSPLQEALLSDGRQDQTGVAGAAASQLVLRLCGNLDPAALAAAWQAALQCHPVLRTSFAWEGLEQPVQLVHRQV